jgi:hypothetical protein
VIRRSWFAGRYSLCAARAAQCEPRRADARRSCECAFVQCRWGVVQRTNVSWTRSGLRKPAVVRERIRFTSRKRTSAARAVHTIKSGWCKPAVRRGRAQLRKNACICKCVTEPRRADVRRSWSDVRTSPNSARCLPHDVRATHHGGLTPAALANVRLCSADGALCSERTCRGPGAAGVSQPWYVNELVSPAGNALRQREPSTLSRAAGVSQPWDAGVLS